MPPIIAEGDPTRIITSEEKRSLVAAALSDIPIAPKRVLLVPPDITRVHSNAGELANIYYDLLKDSAHVDVMPGIGTHTPMTDAEIDSMFGGTIPRDRFLVHDWRHAVIKLGEVPGELVAAWSGGKLDYAIDVEVNQALVEGGYDLIMSIGQVVPHEIAGLANYTKNILVGVGGSGMISRSHYLASVYGVDRLIGQIDTPPRRVMNYGYHNFLGELPIYYTLTVMEKSDTGGQMHMRGLYVGNDDATFEAGARLSQQVNVTLFDKPLNKVIVYLEAAEFKTTWIGNKSVYRTRMAIAEGGDLIILAPGLRKFGEDPEIDQLIRKYGYRGTERTLELVRNNADLRANLSAPSHLIHSSSDGHFTITYCPGPAVTAEEIRSVGFEAGELDEMMALYGPDKMTDGFNPLPDGEEVYFINNPGLGLWALRDRFQQAE